MSGSVLRPRQLSMQDFGHSSACRWELYVWGRVSCLTEKGRYNWIILSGLQSDVVPQNVITEEQYHYVWYIGCLVQTWKYVPFVPCINYVSVQSVWTANVIKHQWLPAGPAPPCTLIALVPVLVISQREQVVTAVVVTTIGVKQSPRVTTLRLRPSPTGAVIEVKVKVWATL
jgi:hypothetical protein